MEAFVELRIKDPVKGKEYSCKVSFTIYNNKILSVDTVKVTYIYYYVTVDPQGYIRKLSVDTLWREGVAELVEDDFNCIRRVAQCAFEHIKVNG